MIELKPCPFCGSTDTDVLRSTDGVKFWGLCETCGAVGGVGSTDEEAVNNWNRRGTTKQNDRALLPCPKCGGRNLIHAPTILGSPKRLKWTTVCEDCWFSGGTSGTVADADLSWNKRAGAAHDEPAP